MVYSNMTIYSDRTSQEYAKKRSVFTSTDSLVFEILENFGISGRDVLDLGCGDGVYSINFSDLGAHSVIGIDNSHKMIELASDKIQGRENVKFLECDGSDMSNIDNESKDLVFSNFVLHHFSDTSKLIDEVYRVLKPGGLFLSTFSAYDVLSGSEYLNNTDISVVLGENNNKVVVHNFVKPEMEVYNNLSKSGFKVLQYDRVDNPDAKIDESYQFRDVVKKLTIISLAKKDE